MATAFGQPEQVSALFTIQLILQGNQTVDGTGAEPQVIVEAVDIAAFQQNAFFTRSQPSKRVYVISDFHSHARFLHRLFTAVHVRVSFVKSWRDPHVTQLRNRCSFLAS